MATTKKPSAYAEAGVDIAKGDAVKHGLKETLKSASRPEVLAAVGGFGGLFDLSKMKIKEPVLVSSVDGVGTKLKLAFETGNHECVGQDIVKKNIPAGEAVDELVSLIRDHGKWVDPEPAATVGELAT